jgi:hypothetical protein
MRSRLKHTASVAPGGGRVSTANMRVGFGTLAHLVQLAVLGGTGVGAAIHGMARSVLIVDDHPSLSHPSRLPRRTQPPSRRPRRSLRIAALPGTHSPLARDCVQNTAAALSGRATLETRRLTSDSGARPSPGNSPAAATSQASSAGGGTNGPPRPCGQLPNRAGGPNGTGGLPTFPQALPLSALATTVHSTHY